MCSRSRRGDMHRTGITDFIGFQVSRDLLERAFQDTYGIEMKDVFGNVTLALGSYRYAIRSIIPGMTRVAWSLKQDQLKKEIPGITRKKFLYNLSRSSYEKEWGKDYHKPGIGHEDPGVPLQISAGRRSLQSAPDPHADTSGGETVHGELQRNH